VDSAKKENSAEGSKPSAEGIGAPAEGGRAETAEGSKPSAEGIGAEVVKIDLSLLYQGDVAKLADLDRYLEQAKRLAGEGKVVIITGQAPIWMYLKVAHALHGRARRLIYRSPVAGEVLIFDHSPN